MHIRPLMFRSKMHASNVQVYRILVTRIKWIYAKSISFNKSATQILNLSATFRSTRIWLAIAPRTKRQIDHIRLRHRRRTMSDRALMPRFAVEETDAACTRWNIKQAAVCIQVDAISLKLSPFTLATQRHRPWLQFACSFSAAHMPFT